MVHYNYNANGSKQSTVYGDGTREDYSYDGALRLTQLTHTDRRGSLLDYYEYSYDAAGNLTGESSTRGTTAYTYDEDGRLASVTEPEGRRVAYTYDAAGNRKSMTTTYGTGAETIVYAYDGQNRLVSETKNGTVDVTYEYDGNGNLLSGTCVSEGITETYSYDPYNRLISYEDGSVSAQYTYNAEDYRTGKTVTESGTTTETHYIYEGNRVIMETDENGTVTARNMYGTHLASRVTGQQTCNYLYNAHGDVVLLTDASTGETKGSYVYDAFGTLIQETGDTDNSITYAGYQYDKESGLYYVNARYYDSTMARFLTEDTYRGSLTDPLSLNRYTYCHNNPLRYTDPSGHFVFSTALAWVGKKVVSGLVGAVIGAGVDIFTQKVINKQEKIDWKSVGYEAAVGAVSGMIGGGAGSKATKKLVETTVKNFAKEGAKKVVTETAKAAAKEAVKQTGKVFVCEAIGGAVTDMGRQYFVEGKEFDEMDYGRVIETAAVSGVSGAVANVASAAFSGAVDSLTQYRTLQNSGLLDVPSMPNSSALAGDVTPNVKKNASKNVPTGQTGQASLGITPELPENNGVVTWERGSEKPKMNLQFFAGESGSTTIHNDILDSPRTGSALKVDDVNPIYKINEKTGKPQIVKEFPATAQSHGFNDIVDNYAGYATKTPLNNATLYQLDGSLNGVAGRFEWIIQDGNVTHRMFIQNGTMNGVPIKP